MTDKYKIIIARIDDEIKKICKSENYNYIFDFKTGHFMRWGKKVEENPQWCSFGPEILDLELSTICSGIPDKNGNLKVCTHCYKSNDAHGKNISFDTFKKILDKMPKTLCQVAFGIGDAKAIEPDFRKIIKYCTDNYIVPNYTTNGFNLSNQMIIDSAHYCGSVAVSAYPRNKDVCYDAVNNLIEHRSMYLVYSDTWAWKFKGPLQVNIHALLSKETLPFCYEIAEDYLSDKRLNGLNAIVFLHLKKTGRAEKSFNNPSQEEYKKLFNFLLEKKIPFGHDSCCYPNMIYNAPSEMKKDLRECCEPCEGSLMSSYINVDGFFYPCSFIEQSKIFEGLDVANCTNFIDDVWMNENTIKFREMLIGSTKECSRCEESKLECRKCPTFDVAQCSKV